MRASVQRAPIRWGCTDLVRFTAEVTATQRFSANQNWRNEERRACRAEHWGGERRGTRESFDSLRSPLRGAQGAPSNVEGSGHSTCHWARHERACRPAEGGLAGESNGAPCTTRTCDLLVRSQTLYPTELRARGFGSPDPQSWSGHRHETPIISQATEHKPRTPRTSHGQHAKTAERPANPSADILRA